MERPFYFSTKVEYPPVPEGRLIHQTILHLLVWGFLFYPVKKSWNNIYLLNVSPKHQSQQYYQVALMP